MSSTITTIALKRMFAVNCYLIETAGDFVLIDTGMANVRGELERSMAAAGCERGALRLIVLTHAHSDHAGSCAYLRDKYGCPIAMHVADAAAVRAGDMFAGENAKRGLGAAAARGISGLLGVAKFDAFEPEVLLDEGDSLAEYGLDARVLHFPGHSPGSIGVFTAEGDFFCGDLVTNPGEPSLNKIIDDAADYAASIARLAGLDIRTVYPGHGEPFPMGALRVP